MFGALEEHVNKDTSRYQSNFPEEVYMCMYYVVYFNVLCAVYITYIYNKWSTKKCNKVSLDAKFECSVASLHYDLKNKQIITLYYMPI